MDREEWYQNVENLIRFAVGAEAIGDYFCAAKLWGWVADSPAEVREWTPGSFWIQGAALVNRGAALLKTPDWRSDEQPTF